MNLNNKNKSNENCNKNINLKNINIVAVNVNSLVSNVRRFNLKHAIDEIEPDMVLVSETKLMRRHRLSFDGYVVIRNDRPDNRGGGGTAIIIKEGIKFFKINLKTRNLLNTIESTIIKISIQNSQHLIIISAYAPGHNRSNFTNDLTHIFNELELHKSNNSYILTGDLNARNLKRDENEENPRGMYLNRWLNANDIKYKIKLTGSVSPTYPETGSFIDLCLCDNRIEISNLQNEKLEVFPFDSDHNGIKMKIELKGIREILLEPAEHPHTLNFNKTIWGQFFTYLTLIKQTLPNNLNLTNIEIDNKIDELEQIIKKALENNTPKYKKINYLKDYILPQIIKLQKAKSGLLSKIHRLKRSINRDKDEIRVYEYTLIEIKQKINNLLNININKYWEKRISKIKIHDHNNLFPEINRIFKNRIENELPNFKINNNQTKIIELAKKM